MAVARFPDPTTVGGVHVGGAAAGGMGAGRSLDETTTVLVPVSMLRLPVPRPRPPTTREPLWADFGAVAGADFLDGVGRAFDC